MDPFVIAAVVAIAGFPVWKLRKDQEPAILREVARLGIHAELDRPTAAIAATASVARRYLRMFIRIVLSASR